MPELKRNCSCYFSIGKFLTLDENTWIRTMRRNAAQPPSPGQIKAWQDSFHVLQQTFSALPAEYHQLHVIFEYALPRYPITPGKAPRPYYVFADAILLGKERAVVLEFKQKKQDYFGDAHQARKYRRRIQDYHDASRGMSKGAILVLTKAVALRERYYKVACCSADFLAAAILDQFGSAPARHPDPKGWCSSPLSSHRK